MIISSVALSQFRIHTNHTFTFSPDLTIIIGPNAIGKTNILEALVMLATGKSFRVEQESDVISFGSEIARLTGMIGDDRLEIMITPGIVNGGKAPRKKYLVNGVSRRMIDFVGRLRVVFFSPEDLLLISGSPSLRRKYLDTVLVQIDREYRRQKAAYEKGLRARNKVLEKIHDGEATRSHLLYWDHLLITSGGYLTQKRQEFLTFLNSTTLAGKQFQAVYDKSIISSQRIEQYQEAEVAAKATLVGPHRDDIIIKIQNSKLRMLNETQKLSDGKDAVELSFFGSRGEQRLGVLWLKQAELLYLTQETGERPVLLLDDIFSELDAAHERIVLSLIGGQQTIITSADPAIKEKLEEREGSVIELT